MRPLFVPAFAMLLALLACSPSSDPAPPDPSGDPDGSERLTVDTTLDRARAVTQDVPTAGGTLEAAAADGTRYLLSIPGDALLDATRITMTPITAIEGFDVDGAEVHGVELQPHGLHLYEVATLEIVPPGGAGRDAVAFAQSGTPEEFHLYPLRPDPARLTLGLLHFSDYVVYLGDGISLPVEPAEIAPAGAAAALEHAAAELIAEERRRALLGEEGDPEFQETFERLMSEYYARVVAPVLPQIAAGCEGMEAHAVTALGWARLPLLLGLEVDFSTELQSVSDAVEQGLANCWRQTAQPCIDRFDGAQMSRLISMSRQMLLLGLVDEDLGEFDPTNPDLQCPAQARIAVEYEVVDPAGDEDLTATGSMAYTLISAPQVLEEAAPAELLFLAEGSGTYNGATETEWCQGTWSGSWTQVVWATLYDRTEDGTLRVEVSMTGAVDDSLDVELSGCDPWNDYGLYRPWEMQLDMHSSGDERLASFPPGETRLSGRREEPWGGFIAYEADFAGLLPDR